MKILKLTADNFKKLTAVEITPDGNVVLITGKNAAGKSSVLDSMEATLRGGRCLPKQPIKRGEIRAKTETILGDVTPEGEAVPEYKVTRKFFGVTSSLIVETLGDLKKEIRSPQAFLNKIVGDISFDPLAFLKESPAEQRSSLMGFLNLNVDEFDAKVVELKIQRTTILAESKRKLAKAESIKVTPNLPEVPQSTGHLLIELNAIAEHNLACTNITTKNAVDNQRLQTLRNSVAEGVKAIAQWEERLKGIRGQITDIEHHLEAHPEVPMKSTAEVEKKIENSATINEAIRRNAERKVAIADYDTLTAKYKDLGDQVKMTEVQKAKKMSEAVMPIKGLTILPDGLAFDGIYLEQVNEAKRLEICVAIAMALNPTLQVLRINGNDLDTDSLTIIAKLIADKDYQVWVEKVMDDNTIGFFIEDGTVVPTPPVEVPSEN